MKIMRGVLFCACLLGSMTVAMAQHVIIDWDGLKKSYIGPMVAGAAQQYQVPVSEDHEPMQTADGLVVNLPKACNKIAPVLRISK